MQMNLKYIHFNDFKQRLTLSSFSLLYRWLKEET